MRTAAQTSSGKVNMAISASLAGRMMAGDQSVYHFNLWRKTVDFIRYIFTGRSLQEDYEVLFNLLNINRPRILDRMPVKDIKALRHVLGFIRMIDNSPPELRSQYGLQGRFCDGRIAVRLSYDDTMIREVLLTEEAFGLLNNAFTVNKRGTMTCVEREDNARAAGMLEARFVAACEQWHTTSAGKNAPPEGPSRVDMIHLSPWRGRRPVVQGLRSMLEGVSQQRY